MEYKVVPVGRVQRAEENYFIHLDSDFRKGLLHLEEFSHLHIIWWAHLTDSPAERIKTVTKNIFRHAPDEVGVFASRTPERPNPVMISIVKIRSINTKEGNVYIEYIDAEDGTPVLDIKPFFPMERVRDCSTPGYYAHWPVWNEDSKDFNWKNEINFDNIPL